MFKRKLCFLCERKRVNGTHRFVQPREATKCIHAHKHKHNNTFSQTTSGDGTAAPNDSLMSQLDFHCEQRAYAQDGSSVTSGHGPWCLFVLNPSLSPVTIGTIGPTIVSSILSFLNIQEPHVTTNRTLYYSLHKPAGEVMQVMVEQLQPRPVEQAQPRK